jgi:hypothetical protein
MIAALSVLVLTFLIAGCTSSTNSPSNAPTKKVTPAQKTTIETSYDITAALADTIEALDAMTASIGFGNGTGGTVTVDGHGTTSVTMSWTGSATSGTATLTVKSGSTTVSTYTITFTGTSVAGTTSLVTTLKGKTSKGSDLDLGINIVKVGTSTTATVTGNVTYSGETYRVSGGSTSDRTSKSASWGYVITDIKTEITMTIAASYSSGAFSGTMTIATKRGVTLATATTNGDGTVTVKYVDGTTVTIDVFPNPSK